jgi:hypothetical protein
MMNRITSPTIFLAMALLLAGCQSNPNGERDVGPAIKTAVGIGTSIALMEHPEWRPAFEMAVADLRVIEQQEKIDFGTVLLVVQNLPVKELRSDTARIVFTSAAILLSEYDSPEIDVTKVRSVVTALREGIEFGLGPEPARGLRKSKAGYTPK